MDIRVGDFIEGARNARGTVVIIDVFRAFSVTCYAFASGASRIIPVGEIHRARALRENNAEYILLGERGGRKLEGFDYGNSPTEILNADLAGRTLVHTTHAGTQGIVNAVHADTILTGSFVNAAATAAWIRSTRPGQVTLVRMGLEADLRSDEDDLCARYLASLIRNEGYDVPSIRPILANSPFSRRFFDPGKPWSPESDFDLCLDIDRFDFAVRVTRDEQGQPFLEKCP